MKQRIFRQSESDGVKGSHWEDQDYWDHKVEGDRIFIRHIFITGNELRIVTPLDYVWPRFRQPRPETMW